MSIRLTNQRQGDTHAGGDDSHAIRGKLQWKPNDDLTLMLTAFYTKQRQDCAGSARTVTAPTSPLLARPDQRELAGRRAAGRRLSRRPDRRGGPVYRDTDGADKPCTRRATSSTPTTGTP